MNPAILIVDDEQRILQSMKRLLRRDGYEIHVAENGPAALEILASTDVAVIICDQRMPGMTGAQVLAESVNIRPDAYRVTVTGYSDLAAIQASINDGGVNHFLLKPWEDEHLRRVVREGVLACQLTQENRRLAAVTREQKSQLEALNRELEDQVKQRTKELQLQNQNLLNLQRRLEQSLRDTVGVLAGLLEACSPNLAIHSKRVAQLACVLGTKLGLDDTDLRDVEFAARLHDIGKTSQLGASIERHPGSAGPQQAPGPPRHPESGCAILSCVGGFENVAQGVRHQSERYDGSGYPDRLRGEDIPLAARIIAVANLYDNVVFSLSTPTTVSRKEGIRALLDARGTRLDASLVDLLLQYLNEVGAETDSDAEVELSVQRLREGMVLSRALHGLNGVLLLPAGTRLTSELLERVRSLSEANPLLAGVFVKCTSDIAADRDAEASRAGPDQPDSAAPSSSVPRDRPKRALIVDDDALVCNALTRELRCAAWETVCVNNGRTAQNVLETEHFDVLLTDLAMPLLSGEELLAHVQQCWPDMRCVILTGNANREQLRRLGGLSCVVQILAKPWDRGRLIATINSAIDDGERTCATEQAR